MELKTYFAQDAAGNIISSAIVNVFLQGTTTLATGLTRADGTPLENPFAADGAGRIQFRAPDGYYDVQVSAGPGIIQTLTIQCVDYTGAKDAATRAEDAADRADASAEQVADAVALRGDLAAPGGAGIVGGLAKPVTWSGFAGGADPTGVLDSTAAFLAANATKSKIYVPSGRYRLSQDVISDPLTSWELEMDVLFINDFTFSIMGKIVKVNVDKPVGQPIKLKLLWIGENQEKHTIHVVINSTHSLNNDLIVKCNVDCEDETLRNGIVPLMYSI